FRSRRDVHELGSTQFATVGKLRVYVPTPGEYILVVDNPGSTSQPVVVRLQGTLRYDTATRPARVLPPERRAVVILSSLAVFFGIAWFGGRRLWGATFGRRTPEPPQPYV